MDFVAGEEVVVALGGGGGVGGLWRRSAQRAPRLLAVPSPHPTASFLMPAATKKGWGRLGLEKWGERARVGGCGAPPFLRSRARGAISLSHGAQAQGAGDEHAKAGPRSEGGTQRARAVAVAVARRVLGPSLRRASLDRCTAAHSRAGGGVGGEVRVGDKEDKGGVQAEGKTRGECGFRKIMK